MFKKKKKKLSLFLTVAISGFLGGMAASVLMQPRLAYAAYQILSGGKLELRNPMGATIADIYVPDGGGGILDLYNENTELRLQAGTYPQGGEKGMPYLGLSDNHSKLRMLTRIVPGNQSPVIIFKDSHGNDRLVMGLDLTNPDQAPFLSIIDKNGKKQNIFGTY